MNYPITKNEKMDSIMPAPNMRFCEIGGKVITQTAAGAKTVSGSPDDVRLNPRLRKVAGTLEAM